MSAPIKSLIVLKVSEPHFQNQIFEMKFPRLSLNPQAEKPIKTAVKKLMAIGTAKYFQRRSLLMSPKVPAYAFMPFKIFFIIVVKVSGRVQSRPKFRFSTALERTKLFYVNQFLCEILNLLNSRNFPCLLHFQFQKRNNFFFGIIPKFIKINSSQFIIVKIHRFL